MESGRFKEEQSRTICAKIAGGGWYSTVWLNLGYSITELRIESAPEVSCCPARYKIRVY